MKERPIILNADMVRATLDGRKTQTRRPIKPQPDHFGLHNCDKHPLSLHDTEGGWHGDFNGETERIKCPFGKPRDRLWVRETWSPCVVPSIDGTELFPKNLYRADNLGEYFWSGEKIKWRPSIHMPRWASRITLEIIDVRVELIKDITDDDIYKEGIREQVVRCGRSLIEVGYTNYLRQESESYSIMFNNPKASFISLWQSIYGKGPYAWEKNPWVWIIETKKI